MEESALVHTLFDSALPKENWIWNVAHESNSNNYVSVARNLRPDVIFLSNSDRKNGYSVVKQIREDETIANVPLVLMTKAREAPDEKQLRSLNVLGYLRKPFDSAALQEWIAAAFKNREDRPKKGRNKELDGLNVFDEEFLDVLSDKKDAKITMGDLESELDPMSQLLSDENPQGVSSENDNGETELLELEPIEKADEATETDPSEQNPLDADFEESDELGDSHELDAYSDGLPGPSEDVDGDLDSSALDFEDDFTLEFESADDSDRRNIVEVVMSDEVSRFDLQNVSETGDYGIREIEVMPGNAISHAEADAPRESQETGSFAGAAFQRESEEREEDPLPDDGFEGLADSGLEDEDPSLQISESDLANLMDLSPEEDTPNIRQMIDLRQVSKAKYDLPPTENGQSIENRTASDESADLGGSGDATPTEEEEPIDADLSQDETNGQSKVPADMAKDRTPSPTEKEAASVGNEEDLILEVGDEESYSDPSLLRVEIDDSDSEEVSIADIEEEPLVQDKAGEVDPSMAQFDDFDIDLENFGELDTDGFESDGGLPQEIDDIDLENSDIDLENSDIDLENFGESEEAQGDQTNREALSENPNGPDAEPQAEIRTEELDELDPTSEHSTETETGDISNDIFLADVESDRNPQEEEASDADGAMSLFEELDLVEIPPDSDLEADRSDRKDSEAERESGDEEMEVSKDVFEIGDFRMEHVVSAEEIANGSDADNADDIAQHADRKPTTKDAAPESEPPDEDFSPTEPPKSSAARKSELAGKLSPGKKAELDRLIEDIVSNAIQDTLKRVLPEVVQKIIREEVKE